MYKRLGLTIAVLFIATAALAKDKLVVSARVDPQVREQVLLVAVGDYLDRSQMVLVELANASSKGPLDISPEQERAQELISETRLYRQTATTTGNTSVTGILDERPKFLRSPPGAKRVD